MPVTRSMRVLRRTLANLVPVRKYEDASAAILWGDATEALATHVAPGSVDLVVADPPYNIGKRFGARRDRWPDDAAYVAWCAGWLDLCVRALAPHGTLYLMASTQSMPHLDLHLRTRLHVLSRIVWAYDSSGVQARRKFGSLYEPILHCVVDPRRYTFDAAAIRVEARTGAQRRLIDHRKPTPALYSAHKVPGNVWTIPRVRYRMPEYEDHPTQKPEALLTHAGPPPARAPATSSSTCSPAPSRPAPWPGDSAAAASPSRPSPTTSPSACVASASPTASAAAACARPRSRSRRSDPPGREAPATRARTSRGRS